MRLGCSGSQGVPAVSWRWGGDHLKEVTRTSGAETLEERMGWGLAGAGGPRTRPPGTLVEEAAPERCPGQDGQPCPEVKVRAEARWWTGPPPGCDAGSGEDWVSASPATESKLTLTDSNANVKPALR